jgi:hypothetical protein
LSFVLSTVAILFIMAAVLSGQNSQTAGAQGGQSVQGATTMTDEQMEEANIQLLRQDIRSKRKQLVAANLPLTDTEATRFWPVYDRYIAETIKINDNRYAVIKEYAKAYQNMTDEQADGFIKRWLALDGDNTQLRLKYVPEFEKVISHKKTAMFFQIDRRVGMMIELQISSQMPLVNP